MPLSRPVAPQATRRRPCARCCRPLGAKALRLLHTLSYQCGGPGGWCLGERHLANTRQDCFLLYYALTMSTRIPSPVPSPSGAGPTTLPFSRIPSHSLGNASTPGSGIPTMERQLSHGSPLTTPPSGMVAYSTPGSGTAQHKVQQHAHDMRESGSDDLAQSGDRVRRNSSNTSLSLHPKTLPPPGSSGRPPTACSLSSLRQRDSGQPGTPRMQSFVAMHGLSTTTRSPATASAPGSRIASGGNSPVPSTPVHTQSPGSTFYSAFSQSHGSQALPPMPGVSPPHEDRRARGSMATGASGGLAGSHVYSSGNNGSSNIMVTVRMRPLRCGKDTAGRACLDSLLVLLAVVILKGSAPFIPAPQPCSVWHTC